MHPAVEAMATNLHEACRLLLSGPEAPIEYRNAARIMLTIIDRGDQAVVMREARGFLDYVHKPFARRPRPSWCTSPRHTVLERSALLWQRANLALI